MKRSLAPGISTTEYALVLGLVTLVGIGGLGLMSNRLNDNLANMIGNRDNTPTTTVVAPNIPSSPQPPSLSAQSGAGIGGVVPQAQAGEEQVCFQSGLCVNIPVISQGTKLDVLAGNGEVMMYKMAKALEQMAQQIAIEEGEESPLAQALSALANQGHLLGDKQSDITALCRKAYPGKASRKTCSLDTYFLPKGLTGNQVRDSYLNVRGAQANFSTMYESMQKVMANYQGPRKNKIAAVVSSQSEQIINIAARLDGTNLTSASVGTPGRASNYGGYATSKTDKGFLTHQSANTICTQGGVNCTRDLGIQTQAVTASTSGG